MNLSERIAAEEDRLAGRVVPGWRLTLAFMATIVTALAVYGVYVSFGFWWSLIPTVLGGAAWEALLGRYKKRSLR